MLIQNIALYEDKTYIRVNKENDALFYFFDYDVRSADINMQFQHFHPFYELCILLGPKATHFLEGKPYYLETFDIMGITPGRLHMTQYPEGDPCRRLIIQFGLPRSVAGLNNEFEQLMSVFHQETPIFRFAPEIRTKLYNKLNGIFRLAGKKDPMRDLSVHLKFVEFLTLLYLNKDNNLYTNTAEMSPTQKKIYAVAAHIHAHYSEPLSLESLAGDFFISSCYLSHQFKAVTGFTVTDYIQMTRVRNVQSMLIREDVPITEAALACGFQSFSQFNRVFQKHIGMTPSQYRKKHRTHPAWMDE